MSVTYKLDTATEILRGACWRHKVADNSYCGRRNCGPWDNVHSFPILAYYQRREFDLQRGHISNKSPTSWSPPPPQTIKKNFKKIYDKGGILKTDVSSRKTHMKLRLKFRVVKLSMEWARMSSRILLYVTAIYVTMYVGISGIYQW